MKNQYGYAVSELLMSLVLMILVIGLINIGFDLAENKNTYVDNSYIKVEADGHDTPYDQFTVFNDDTIEIYYQNELVRVPYRMIDKDSFSFVLPNNDQKYIVKIITKSIFQQIDNTNTVDTTQKISSAFTTQPESNKQDAFITTPIAVVTNDDGFKQLLVDKQLRHMLTPANYDDILDQTNQ